MSVEHVGVADVDRLEPLWLLLHAHHQEVAPELAPYVDDARSWSVRRALYETVLADGGFALVAREGAVDVGYLVAAMEPTPWPATFAGASDVAELVTLVVRPESRGLGVGSALLEAFDARLAAAGIVDTVIGVVPANTRAIALYRRRGFEPTWLTLTRFARPPRSVQASQAAAVGSVPPAEVDALRPLWLALHHHHQAVAPRLAPFVSDRDSWDVVRGLLVRAADDGLLLRVGPTSTPLGLACVSITRDDPLWADTWLTGPTIAEITLLVVADDARGRGLGSALLDAVDERLTAAGVLDQVVGAIEPNRDAIRFYARRGFQPTWLRLTRFARRDNLARDL